MESISEFPLPPPPSPPLSPPPPSPPEIVEVREVVAEEPVVVATATESEHVHNSEGDAAGLAPVDRYDEDKETCSDCVI